MRKYQSIYSYELSVNMQVCTASQYAGVYCQSIYRYVLSVNIQVCIVYFDEKVIRLVICGDICRMGF